MRSRRPSPEHEQAVARRLAALGAEWDAARAQEGAAAAAPGPVPATAEAGPHDDAGPAWEPHTRIRDAVVAPAAPVAPDVPVAPAVPVAPGVVEGVGSGTPPSVPVPQAVEVSVPGRHAARRRGAALARVPSLPLDRVGLRAVHLVWVALFASTALTLSAWWVVQGRDVEVVTPVSAPVVDAGPDLVPTPGSAPTGTAPAGTAPTGTAEESDATPVGEVVVDVAGKVRRPGIVVLPAGSRVHDAIEAAGGARRGVDLQSLNLARVLVDGEQVVVGAPQGPVTGAGPAPSPGVPPGGTATTPGGLVNLNSASVAELETLPGVGPVTAEAIVEWRTRHGGFSAVEDLLEVHGIGEVTLEQLAPLVTV